MMLKLMKNAGYEWVMTDDSDKELSTHVVWAMIMIKNGNFHIEGDDNDEEHEIYPRWVGDDNDENKIHVLTMGW
jgi:hypothetical protein